MKADEPLSFEFAPSNASYKPYVFIRHWGKAAIPPSMVQSGAEFKVVFDGPEQEPKRWMGYDHETKRFREYD